MSTIIDRDKDKKGPLPPILKNPICRDCVIQLTRTVPVDGDRGEEAFWSSPASEAQNRKSELLKCNQWLTA